MYVGELAGASWHMGELPSYPLKACLQCVNFPAFYFTVFCSIQTPSSLTTKVGKDVVFMWNTTNRILVANWGLKDPVSNSFKTKFIYTDISPTVAVQPGVANTAYKGRVSFVGNLAAGHAWFKITSLSVSDTNTYGADIREDGDSLVFSSVNLQVTGRQNNVLFQSGIIVSIM